MQPQTIFMLVTTTGEIVQERPPVAFPASAPPPDLPAGKGLRWLPVVDSMPTPSLGETLTGPEVTVTADAVTRTWTVEPIPLEQARRAKVCGINAERDRRLSIGAPFGGKRIDVSDKGRADLAGLSVAALLAQAGAAPWPDSYARGWIADDNSRIPLPTPEAALVLAASVGTWYGLTIQHARDRKDDALASTDPAAVDEVTGWPE